MKFLDSNEENLCNYRVHTEDQTLPSILKVSEKVMIQDLQNVDFISQKLAMILQYMENIQRAASHQEMLKITGDTHIFHADES